MASRLQQHFSKADSHTVERWDVLWKDNYAPWDRGQASPALYDLLKERHDLTGSSWAQPHVTGGCSKRRKRALVPGCGRGYEVLMLAQFGYDSFGVDGSDTAIEAANKLAQDTFAELPAEGAENSKGQVKFATGDFFRPDWLQLFGLGENDRFDIIYDYTFFCALPPSLRSAWAQRMSQLLSAAGTLICLEFPLYKDPALGGPPFALRAETYVQHLLRPGENIQYDNGFVIESERSNEAALIRVDRWFPQRTHDAGKDSDHISVWQHK